MKSLIQPLKFGNGQVYSSHNLLDMFLLTHVEFKGQFYVSKRSPKWTASCLIISVAQQISQLLWCFPGTDDLCSILCMLPSLFVRTLSSIMQMLMEHHHSSGKVHSSINRTSMKHFEISPVIHKVEYSSSSEPSITLVITIHKTTF